MNKNILIGLIGLVVLASAAFVTAGMNATNVVQVMNIDDNTTYWVKILATQNTYTCFDSDHGMKPSIVGTIDVNTLNPAALRTLHDRSANGVIREFMCGNDVILLDRENRPTWAYVVFYDQNNPFNPNNNNPPQ